MLTYWLCEDCLFGEAYGDFTALSLHLNEHGIDRQKQRIEAGLEQLMPISADFDAEGGWGIDEFSRSPCDCCQTPLHGKRYRYTTL